MKLLRVFTIFSIIYSVNLFAATISGNVYCDMNDNGTIETGEVCSSEGIWVKLYNVTRNRWIQVPLTSSGTYSFDVGTTGDFRVFIDNNGDTVKDSTPTPPTNMLFKDPADGTLDVTIASLADNRIGNNFVLIPDPACDCSGGDNQMTKVPIAIDGNMNDWSMVLLDPDNGICDSSTIADYDINKTQTGEIQSTGRNLTHFAWTGQDDENGFVYGYTERVGSTTNTETFLFYKDGDADGLMESGDIALVAGWQGNTGTVKMEICDYEPANQAGDPMVWQPSDVGTPLLYPGGTTVPQEWVGQADGYTLRGGLTNCRTSQGLVGAGSADGLRMEWQVPWKTVNMLPFQRITYHVSTMNASVNQTNPPGQVDDNMGSCLLAAPAVKLGITKTADTTIPRVGDDVTYTITVTNSGDPASGVVVNDTLPTGMAYVSYSGTDWTCTNNAQDVSCNYVGVLLNGASSSVQIVASVDAGTLGDTLTNTACVVSDENSTLVCEDESITVASSVLEISKGVSDATPYVNEIVTYEIDVTNTGPNIAYNVALSDSLPAGIDYIGFTGADWVCTETSSNVIACNYTSPLGVGETTTVTFGVQVTGAPGDIINEACVDTDDSTTEVCDNVTLTALPTPTDVVLSMAKGVDENTPLIGETITYTISVINVGNTQATNVNVTDILPAGLNFVSATGGGSYDSTTRTISWLGLTLDSSQSEIFTITATVNDTAEIGTAVNNEVCAVADENLTPQCANIDFVPRAPIVTMLMDKSVDNENPRVGDNVIYTLVVTNNGSDTATNVTVDDTLPTGLIYNGFWSATAGSYDGTTWNIGTLVPGASEELNITATISTETEGDLISNVATVSATESLTPISDDANLTVYAPTVILTIQKVADQNFPPEGAEITYTVIVNNIGNGNATGVAVTDTLPEGVTFDSAGGNGWTCDETVYCINDALILQPGIPSSFDINVTVNPDTAGTTLTNEVCTIADQNQTQVCTSNSITVNENLDLVVTKSVNNAAPAEGETIFYTVTVANNGPITATGVEITENIVELTGLTNISAVTDVGTFDGHETWSVGTLNAGQTATLTVTATVASGASGSYTNFAALTGLDQDDIDPDSNFAQATITVIPVQPPSPVQPDCGCDNISSDGSPALNVVTGTVMILLTLMIGLYFVRREEQLKRHER